MNTQQRKDLLKQILTAYNEKISPYAVKIEKRNGFICFDLHKGERYVKMLFSATTHKEAVKLAYALCETLNIQDLAKQP